ncbi:MAG: 4-hydroxythreonine-4-phosphate dehydrogenase PdxA [Pseudomonadota bacterium]
MTPPLAITMGDAAGIGPEIIAKALAEGAPFPCVVIGSAVAMQHAVRMAGVEAKVVAVEKISDSAPAKGRVEVLDSGYLPEPPETGTVSAAAGAAAYRAIVQATDLAMAGTVAGIVTAPIHKEALAAASVPYPGHTEMLADHAKTPDVAMMLANDDIRTVLVTIHMSLADAIRAADFDAQMAAIRLAQTGTRALGIEAPRVAVAGLNPHAGEGGLFGREEIEIIAPAIAAARAEGINASGPWPGDTVFMQARKGNFDVVVAQYHDQGLIPVKYLGVETGVNITLGLPFVRTSPDHGTAFDIAGQGIADHASLRTAIAYAARLWNAKA